MSTKDIWFEYDAYWPQEEPVEGRQEWGEPEKVIERELEERFGPENIEWCGSGTELLTFRRDVDYGVTGDVGDMHAVMRQHPEVEYRIQDPYWEEP